MRAPRDMDAIASEAVAALEAQRILAGIAGGTLAVDHGWLAFCELAATYGWKSAPCREFICEIAKRAAGR